MSHVHWVARQNKLEILNDDFLTTKRSTREKSASRRVSILVLGSNLKKWNKNWNKFELRLDNFTPIFIPIFGGPKFSGINIRNWNCLRIFPNLNVPKVGMKIGKCLDYVPQFLHGSPSTIYPIHRAQ